MDDLVAVAWTKEALASNSLLVAAMPEPCCYYFATFTRKQVYHLLRKLPPKTAPCGTFFEISFHLLVATSPGPNCFSHCKMGLVVHNTLASIKKNAVFGTGGSCCSWSTLSTVAFPSARNTPSGVFRVQSNLIARRASQASGTVGVTYLSMGKVRPTPKNGRVDDQPIVFVSKLAEPGRPSSRALL